MVLPRRFLRALYLYNWVEVDSETLLDMSEALRLGHSKNLAFVLLIGCREARVRAKKLKSFGERKFQYINSIIFRHNR